MISYTPVQAVAGISLHGLLAGVGFLVGLQLFTREVVRRGVAEQTVVNAFTWSILLGVAGARLAFVATHLGAFHSAGDLLAVRRGGLALFGALVGGAIPPVLVGLRLRAHIPRGFDVAAPAIALGIAVGRIGDLLVWDHLGTPVPSWLRLVGYTVRPGYHLAPGFGPSPAVALPPGLSCRDGFFAGCTYHEAALYDLAGALLLFAVLLLVRRRSRAGVAICTFALWYGTQRLVIDNVRATEVHRIFGLSGAQAFGGLLALAGLGGLVLVRARGRGLGEQPGDPPSRLGPLVAPPALGDQVGERGHDPVGDLA